MGDLDSKMLEEWADRLEAGVARKDEALELAFNFIKKLGRTPEIIDASPFSITIALKCEHGGYEEAIALDEVDGKWLWEETGWGGPHTEECTKECGERFV